MGFHNRKKVKVKHIQWSEINYEKYISQVDIGIVPNFIPVCNDDKKIHRQIFRTRCLMHKAKPFLLTVFKRILPPINRNIYNAHDTDYVIRYKATSNPGRIFVFVQFGIPVVADMFPSALQFIDNEINGFVCYSTEAWYRALKQLADNPVLRTEFAQRMMKKFKESAAPKILNERLVKFINDLKSGNR